MADNKINEELNRLLIRLAKSLIQYAGECWPWVEESGDQYEAVCRVVACQKKSIAQLADLLSARDWTIDWGVYPDYSDLHYIALDFLLDKLIAAEEALVRQIEQTIEICSADIDAVRLLRTILATECKNHETLKNVSNACSAALESQ